MSRDNLNSWCRQLISTDDLNSWPQQMIDRSADWSCFDRLRVEWMNRLHEKLVGSLVDWMIDFSPNRTPFPFKLFTTHRVVILVFFAFLYLSLFRFWRTRIWKFNHLSPFWLKRMPYQRQSLMQRALSFWVLLATHRMLSQLLRSLTFFQGPCAPFGSLPGILGFLLP